MSAKVVGGVTNERSIFEGAYASSEGESLRQTEHIRPRSFEDQARAAGNDGSVGITTGCIFTRGAATSANLLDFESCSVSDGIALAFLEIHHDSFLWISASRV